MAHNSTLGERCRRKKNIKLFCRSRIYCNKTNCIHYGNYHFRRRLHIIILPLRVRAHIARNLNDSSRIVKVKSITKFCGLFYTVRLWYLRQCDKTHPKYYWYFRCDSLPAVKYIHGPHYQDVNHMDFILYMIRWNFD